MTVQIAMQNRVQEKTILNEIWQSVLPHLTTQQRMLEELAAVFQRCMNVTSFDLLLMDQEGRFLHSMASWNAERRIGKTIALGEGVCGHVAQTGQLYNVPDVTQEPLCARRSSARSRAELVVPLQVDDHVLGVIDLRREQPGAFSREDEALITAVAKQVAYALYFTLRYNQLENAIQESAHQVEEQTRELRAERDRADFLYQVTQEMTRTLELERVLNRTLVRVSQALSVRQASILLLDPESGYLVYRAALGRPIALPKGGKPTRFRRGVGLAGWVLEHNEHAIITGIDQDPRWDVDPKKRGQSQSVLAVPLSSEGEVLGVMLLFHPEPNYFSQDHIWLAMAAANHITVAVKNTELYRLIREHAARLSQMLHEQRSIASQRMAILASIADGVAVSDEDDQIAVVNDAVWRVMRLAKQDLIGRPVSMLFVDFPEETQLAVRQAMVEVANRQLDRSQIGTVSIMLNREQQVIQASFTPMLDERQQFAGTVIVLRDVTYEQEIAQAKNEFISIVAHELRTPMTSIKGYTDLMLQGAMGALTEGQKHFLNIVKSNVDRLTDLVSDLLDTSRIEAGRVRLDIVPLQMDQIVHEVCDSLSETISDRGLTLEIDPAPNIPIVHADRNSIIQVLVNLLSNAYRYTPAGGTITVSVRPVNGAVLVEVADTGIGIPEEDREKIFEPFYRADQPLVNQQPGTGLGLPIVRSLVQMHGGRLWLQSELDKGSTFGFTLPLKDGRQT